MAPFCHDHTVTDARVRTRAEIAERRCKSFARDPRLEVTFHPETSARREPGRCRFAYENTVVIYPGCAHRAERCAALIEGDGFLFAGVSARLCTSASAC